MPRRIVVPPELRSLAAAAHGIVATTEATKAGVSPGRLARLVRHGHLTRTGRGTFVLTEELQQLSAWPAFALRSRAFLAACGPNTATSSMSAAAIWKLPMLGAPPERPIAMRIVSPGPAPSTTSSSYGLVHASRVPTEYVVVQDGAQTVRPCWAAVDVARTSRRAGLVAADAVLESGASRSEMTAVLERMTGCLGIGRARWAVQHAVARAESPLESLGRYGFLVAGVPLPLSNVWVGPGYPLYRVDHLWPDHGVVAEADGGLKYRGADPADVVTAEKEREHYLRRELGLDVWRYNWALALRAPKRLAETARTVLQTNPPGRRRRPVQWWWSRW